MNNTFTIDADIKKTSYINEPTVTSSDDITFIVNVFDDGQAFDLETVTTVTLANTRQDKEVVLTVGAKTGLNQVTVNLGTNETAVSGRVDAVIQLYDANGRVSTLAFSYLVKVDPMGAGYVPSTSEQTLIDIVLNDGPLRIQEAIDAAIYANTQGDYALAQGDIAATESADLSVLKTDVQTATTDANTAATTTNQVGTDAQLAEDIRVTSENTRVTSEITRQSQESARQTDTGTAITNAETATTSAIEATVGAQSVADNTRYVEPYSALTAYAKNNVVNLNGSSFISLQDDNLGNTPSSGADTLFWAILALRGLDGTGAVSTVNGVSPDAEGDVAVNTEQVNVTDIKSADVLPANYPVGLSMFTASAFTIEADPWKSSTGHPSGMDSFLVQTSKNEGEYVITQRVTFNSNTGGVTGIYERSSHANNSWSGAWKKVVSDAEFQDLSQLVEDNATTTAAHLADYTQFKGDLSTLQTTAKDNIPNIINELFTNVSDGKTQIATAITDVDNTLSPSGSDSFQVLADTIRQISAGSKVASGTTMTSSFTSGFNRFEMTLMSRFHFEIVGLNFRPMFILAYRTGTSNSNYSFYAFDYNFNNVSNNTIQDNGTIFKVNSAGAYVNDTGFRIPFNVQSAQITWIAIE